MCQVAKAERSPLAQSLKRTPSALGARRWSNYARLALRNYNELEDDFHARLNPAYKPAVQYLSGFRSPLLIVLAKNVAFFTGSIFAVLLILTLIDDDVLRIDKVLTTFTLLGVLSSCLSAFCELFALSYH